MNVTLRNAQRDAVDSPHPKILCVAGPGSGKTEVLAQRVRRIVYAGADPRQIVAITYTNQAAINLEQRANGVDYDGNEKPRRSGLETVLGFAGTLHGFCLRMLRDHGGLYGYGARTGVIDEDAARELLADKAQQQGSKTSVDKLIELKAKGRPIRVGGAPYTRDQLVVLAYCEELRDAGLLDFDLILTEFFRILKSDAIFSSAISGRFTHIFWDEMQDSAAVDWDIAIEIPIANKFFVGDPDQSIFGFRGATPGRLLEYAKRPDVLVLLLDDNFRCGTEICGAANALIRNNEGRIDKLTVPANGWTRDEVTNLGPARNEGAEIVDVFDVVRSWGNDYDGSVAILARSNAIADEFRARAIAEGYDVEEEPKDDLPKDWGLARALVEFLAQKNSDTLGFFYVAAKAARDDMGPLEARAKAHEVRRTAQAAGKTIAAFWFAHFAMDNPHDRPVANYIGRILDREGISRESTALIVEKMRELPAGSSLVDLALAVSRNDRPAPKRRDDAFVVTTIHAAKGREWDAVFIVGFEDELCPGRAKSADVEEERRLAFVAITRARKAVFFSSSATRRAVWGNRPVEDRTPSRFIREALG